jgi:hypothetical protein
MRMAGTTVLQGPYLRSFVVARINPLRWIKGDELTSNE